MRVRTLSKMKLMKFRCLLQVDKTLICGAPCRSVGKYQDGMQWRMFDIVCYHRINVVATRLIDDEGYQVGYDKVGMYMAIGDTLRVTHSLLGIYSPLADENWRERISEATRKRVALRV